MINEGGYNIILYNIIYISNISFIYIRYIISYYNKYIYIDHINPRFIPRIIINEYTIIFLIK